LVPQSAIQCEPYDLLQGKIKSPDSNLCLAANGSVYRKDVRGHIPEIIERLFDKRADIKRQMLDAEQKAQDATNEADKKKWKSLKTLLNTEQTAIKLAMNSLYGALANKYFRYFELSMAEGITLTGQTVIKSAEKSVNDYMNKVLETSNVDYIVALDTDSLYINCGPLVKKFQPKNPLEFLNKFAVQGIEPVFEKTFQAYAERTNAYANKMSMKREVIANRGIWTAAKHYILNVLDSEGVRYKEPKMKIMGIEAIKSSTPAVCRKAMKKLFKILVNENEQAVQKFMSDFKTEFKSMEPHEIAFPRGVSDVQKYMDKNTIYCKGTPINSRAAILYNYYVQKHDLTHKYELIHNGDNIRFLYLLIPNTIRENVIGFPDRLPPELDLDKYIDFETQFYKTFEKPMEPILKAMGWTSEPQSNLDLFFG
jgi:DNA polymerase elongation subunit (family B)